MAVKTVLVSGASGIVGYGILRSLKRSGEELKLIGSSIYDDSVAPGFCDVFVRAPMTSEPEYMDWLLNTIKKHQVDLIIPGIEIDLYKWTDCHLQIKESGATPVLNKIDLIQLCRDKMLFYERIKAEGFSYSIPSYPLVDFETVKANCGLPFLVKPRRGFGGRGIVRVHDKNDYTELMGRSPENFMAQPIVGDDDNEFTTSVFGDGSGSYSASMTLRRRLSSEGFTGKAEVADGKKFEPAIKQLCEIFKPIGPTNFQFRDGKEGIKLLEINPRISSSTSIRTAFGYNESAMTLQYFLNRKLPSQPPILRGKAVRYTEDFVFYEDSVHL